jgi:hypothetical protein
LEASPIRATFIAEVHVTARLWRWMKPFSLIQKKEVGVLVGLRKSEVIKQKSKVDLKKIG